MSKHENDIHNELLADAEQEIKDCEKTLKDDLKSLQDTMRWVERDVVNLEVARAQLLEIKNRE